MQHSNIRSFMAGPYMRGILGKNTFVYSIVKQDGESRLTGAGRASCGQPGSSRSEIAREEAI